jgi:hypothetical protein
VEDLAEVLTEMLRELPRVTAKRRGKHASFSVGKKVFAFMGAQGVAMKLPKEKIAKLAGRRDVSMLVMGKRVMKEWEVVTHKNPAAYKKIWNFSNICGLRSTKEMTTSPVLTAPAGRGSIFRKSSPYPPAYLPAITSAAAFPISGSGSDSKVFSSGDVRFFDARRS